MSDRYADPLWPHFAPLWADLRAITPNILLAGGYGLFLKQCWLDSQVRVLGTNDGKAIVDSRGTRILVDEVRTLVPMHQWKNQTPRVTADLDLIAALDVIASPQDQKKLQTALEKNQFQVVPKNAYWQFSKPVEEDKAVLLDFHAPSPLEDRPDLRVESRRVKPNPSLHGTGIHGHENAEALGCELHPFTFTYNGVEIVIPNPATLACMKLVAMRDRRVKSQNPGKSAEERNKEELHARKHAQDVFRVMAMVTREENERVSHILHQIRNADAFAEAAGVLSAFFGTDGAWGTQTVADSWETADFRLIQSILADWFQRSDAR